MNLTSAIKICHLTTVHVRYDTRIFYKECVGLSEHGYEVTLIVADGKGDELKGGVQIIDIGKPSGRIHRLLAYHRLILKSALKLDASLYHIHDPELLRISKTLIKKGKKVIYDSHEDVPRQVLDKAYLPKWIRKPLSGFLERFEDNTISKFSGVVTVTPNLCNRFLRSNRNVIEVRNFPLLKEFGSAGPFVEKENAICYVGAISKVRGILNMVDAMTFTDNMVLLLGGKFENEDLRKEAVDKLGWDKVSELGFLNRDEVRKTMLKSVAGLVVLKPTRSYLESIPVKMFEYMMAGIPVIASDFPYWRELIEQEHCAIFVDPESPSDIGGAINKLVKEKKLAKRMGANGRQAVISKFNWSEEQKKLLEFYELLLEER